MRYKNNVFSAFYFIVGIKEQSGVNREEKLNLWNQWNCVNSLIKYLSLRMEWINQFLLLLRY